MWGTQVLLEMRGQTVTLAHGGVPLLTAGWLAGREEGGGYFNAFSTGGDQGGHFR